MDQRKKNISRWYALGLAGILAAGCMMLSVGTAYARYRVDREKWITFAPETAAQAAIGTMEDGIYDPNGTIGWQEVLLTEGEGSEAVTRRAYRLELALSNYRDLDGYDKEDMQVRIRLVGSQDVWKSETGGTVVLTDGTLKADGTPRELTAQITPIQEGTRLYYDFGMGWEFRFLDDSGQEVTWNLKGGELSCVPLQITIDASALSGTSLLQLQVQAERGA